MGLRTALDFLLYDWLKAEELTARSRFADHSRETCDAVLDTCERIAREKYAPFNRTVDLAGYYASLDYAKNRPQGRPVGPAGKDPSQPQVRIIEHADIRRMLLAQKSYCEGALALELYCARLVDEQHTGAPQDADEARLLLEVLTPIAKSWPSEWCLEANSLAIQIHGDYGYTRDFPVEQYWRDAREALANAVPYMQAFGHMVLAWIWLDVALSVPADTQSSASHVGRLAAARYFFRYELPKIAAWLGVVSNRDPTCAQIPEEAF